MNILYYTLQILLFICILLYLYRTYIAKKNFEIQTFNIKATLPLKGIMALFICLGHLANWVLDLNISYMERFCYWGPYIVSVFFFITGYGLVISYQKKGSGYLDGFIKHRFSKLLPPIVIATVIYQVFKFNIGDSSWIKIYIDLLKGFPPLDNSWYVYAVLIYYLVFYISFKYISHKKSAIVATWIFSVLYIYLITNVLNWGGYWTQSILAINLGMTYVYIEPKIKVFVSRYTFLSSFIVFMGLMLSYKIFFLPYIIHKNVPFCYIPFILAVPMTLLFCTYIAGSIRSRILYFIGKISYEFYLVHGVFVVYLNYMKTNWISYFIIVYLVSIFSAYALQKVSLLVIKIFIK